MIRARYNSSHQRLIFVNTFAADSIWLPGHILSEANHVWIRVMPLVKAAKEVTVEALSAHDWARIQQYSNWLEDGGFLRQISLVYVDQDICVHLPDDSVVCVRTLHVDKEHAASKTIWPDDSDHHHDDKWSNESFCRRVLEDTELVLLPASTEDGNDAPTQTAFRLQADLHDYSSSMQQLYTRLGQVPHLVSCSHGTAVLHPENWRAENPYGNLSIIGESGAGFLKSYKVRVEISEHVEKGCIGTLFGEATANYKLIIHG